MAGFVKRDLLSTRPVARLVRAPWFPVLLQVLALAAILAVATVGWDVGRAVAPAVLAVLRKTNLASLLAWGLWWPAMVVVMVLAGRVWCTVCPLELVDRLGDWFGRRLGLRRLPVGRILLAGWGMLGVYFLFHVLVAVAGLHKVPHLTAVVVLALVGTAFLAGSLFRHPRAFCTTFCPAGVMLSVYGRFTPVQLEVRRPETCSACRTKDCIREEHRYRFDARSCPSLLRPYARKPSDGCTLCFQCAKVCPMDNVGFGLVAAEAPIRRAVFLTGAETTFVLLVSGFLVHEIAEDVAWLDGPMETLLGRLAAVSGLGDGWTELFLFLLAVPVVSWGLVAAGAVAAGSREGLGRLLVGAATAAAPLVAAVHAVKGLAKIFEWGPYLSLAFRDPRGMETMAALRSSGLAPPQAWIGTKALGWFGLAILGSVAWWAWRRTRGWEPTDRIAGRAAVGVMLGIFGGLLGCWAVAGS